MNTEKTTDCVPFEKVIIVDRLARAYVPIQQICKVYGLDDSLANGTVFPELYMPYNRVPRAMSTEIHGEE